MERGLTGPLSISSPQLADFYSAAVACVRSAVDILERAADSDRIAAMLLSLVRALPAPKNGAEG